jgi:hypothetical protein
MVRTEVKTVPYVDKVKSVKKTLGFPNQGERYGAKYENGVAYLLSYTVSVEKMWTQNTCINEKPRCAPKTFKEQAREVHVRII